MGTCKDGLKLGGMTNRCSTPCLGSSRVECILGKDEVVGANPTRGSISFIQLSFFKVWVVKKNVVYYHIIFEEV